MAISITEMFSIGVGPSSSHTVGPMRAANRFADYLLRNSLLAETIELQLEIFGSLAHTGVGHGTDRAIILGLLGELPETVDPDTANSAVEQVLEAKRLAVMGSLQIDFEYSDIVFRYDETLPAHPNGMRFTAYNDLHEVLFSRCYYSVGGGFVHDDKSLDAPAIVPDARELKHPFKSAKILIELCQTHGLSISGLMLENELAWRSKAETLNYLTKVWQTMEACIDRGCHTEGILPGGLKVKRRAAHLYRKLKSDTNQEQDPLKVMDWVNLYALAVNEENAAGGRVVTAPTNGAAGIIPAVISYFKHFKEACDTDTIARFLLTAGAIGVLFKENASISGAEVGCQGEVGVACSMAAAGLTEIMGGSVEQCQVAAEIGMEHNLGLTCDPVGGLVQIPCIERNAMAAVTAINAARLAMHGDGSHKVSLDEVIATMRQTGKDMKEQYKETAKGGLAVNLIEC